MLSVRLRLLATTDLWYFGMTPNKWFPAAYPKLHHNSPEDPVSFFFFFFTASHMVLLIYVYAYECIDAHSVNINTKTLRLALKSRKILIDGNWSGVYSLPFKFMSNTNICTVQFILMRITANKWNQPYRRNFPDELVSIYHLDESYSFAYPFPPLLFSPLLLKE